MLVINDDEIIKQYNNYEILLKKETALLRISMVNKNNSIIYEANYSLNELQKKFCQELTIEEISNEISTLIDEEMIEINGKLFILKRNESLIELKLEISLNSILNLEKRINELFKLITIISVILIMTLIIVFSLILEYETKNKINKLDERINEFDERIKTNNNASEKINEMNIEKINNTIENINNKIETIKEMNIENINDAIENINNKIVTITEMNVENINNEIENINNKIETVNEKNIEKINEMNIEINKIKNQLINSKIQLMNSYFTSVNTINNNNSPVNSIKIFPSGNIISVSSDKSIIIYDNNFNILQKIDDAHSDGILYVDIKDENNFVTCSYDYSIKTWIKKNNVFTINQTISNAHGTYFVYKVIYDLSNNNLISCSMNKTLKIWSVNNSRYQLIKTINEGDFIRSMLLLKNKNILVYSGDFGTRFVNSINYENLFESKTSCTYKNNALERIDDDTIAVESCTRRTYINIISISLKKIVKQIPFNYYCNAIKSIENKGIFFIFGYFNNINNIFIYRIDNYDLIQIIENNHLMNGFEDLKNNSIVSYGNKTIIWSL
jgi:hypothetical protein